MKNIYLKFIEMQQAGQGLVLATVVRTIGSTPQKTGSSAIFENGRLFCGTIGGGVVEGKVQEAAKYCSQSGTSRYMHFFLDSDISDKEEAICGGEIYILIDANPLIHMPVFREIWKSVGKRESGVLVTRIVQSAEDQVDIGRYWMTGNNRPSLPERFSEKVEPEAIHIIADGSREGIVYIEPGLTGEESSSVYFLEPLTPLPQLIIAGAGHIGKALSHLAKLLDFEVTVIDDRADFANPVNLPDADHIIVRNVGEAMTEAKKCTDTFFVIVTRGHSDDAKALKPCIGSGAGYVGMIGSKGKIALMKADFIEKKWATEEQWKRIHTPIGLDIKSKTVEEIAISIAAELILVKNSSRKI